MAGCGYPGCDWAGTHRPYSRARDGIPSASTIAGLADDKGGMVWASAMIAATTAVHHPDMWEHLGTDGCTEEKTGLCPACRYLRSEHDRQWKAKAALGTHVHHLVADLAEGKEVDSDSTVDPYLDGWEKFVVECEPEWVHLERTVLYNRPRAHAYRGQTDFIGWLTVDGERSLWLGDWKTGRYWPTQQTLQLAGYRFAQHLTRWDSGKEEIDVPVPAVAHAGVICLDDQGGYQLHELPANGDAHSTFLRLRDVYGWQRQMDRWAKEQESKQNTTTTPEGEAA